MADSLEELEEANEAQVLEEAGGDWKTLYVADSLEEQEEADNAQVLEEAGGYWKTLQMSRISRDWVYDSSPMLWNE